jgi:hypothetical protein
MAPRRAAVSVLAASIALAGCGGGGSGAKSGSTKRSETAAPAPAVGGGAPAPTASARPGPTKAAYIKRADKVCAAARARLIPLRAATVTAAKGADPNGVFKRYAQLTGRAAAVYGDASRQLRALRPPAAGQAQIALLNQLVAQIAQIESQISVAAAAQDAARIKALNSSVTRTTDAYNSGARSYGFKVCGTAAAQQPLNRRGNR